MPIHSWSRIGREQMNPRVARRVVHTERMTISRLELAAGAVVPRHHHENEQVTMLETGKLRFVFDDGERLLQAGEMMQIPPDAPHEVHALEDSVAVDVFAPVRSDWLRGEDAYLRR